MPKTNKQNRADSSARQQAGPVRDQRFDPPHEVARDDASRQSSSAEEAASAEAPPVFDAPNLGVGPGTLPEVIGQFRKQAQQLAAHLEARQRDLDRREAQLNSQLAQHEVAARSARLWFQERHHDLTQRQTELDERQAQPNPPANEPLANTLEPSSPQPELLSDVDKLSARELEELRQNLHAWEERLSSAESLLFRGQLDLEAAWQQLHTEHQQWQKQIERERGDVGDQQSQAEAELAKEREKVAARASHLEMRSAALDQLRGEVLHIQRETLEIRLATEELWARMSRSVPPAAVTQSLAHLRAKLAEQNHLHAADVAAQRQEVEELTARLAQQHERLTAQRHQLEQWSIEQQREIETQAARLVAREKELELEHQTMTQQRLKWDAERRDLEREVRRLHGELRRLETTAAV